MRLWTVKKKPRKNNIVDTVKDTLYGSSYDQLYYGYGGYGGGRLCSHTKPKLVFQSNGKPHLWAVANARRDDAFDLTYKVNGKEYLYERVVIVGPAAVVSKKYDSVDSESIKKILKRNPWTKDLAEYIGDVDDYQASEGVDVVKVPLPWPDFQFPQAKRGFWLRLVDKLAGSKTAVLATCVGAHGRTGTTLAILSNLLGYTSGETAMDIVQAVRSKYCESAIESEEQLWYISYVLGLPEGNWKPRKSPYPANSYKNSHGKGSVKTTVKGTATVIKKGK